MYICASQEQTCLMLHMEGGIFSFRQFYYAWFSEDVMFNHHNPVFIVTSRVVFSVFQSL